MNREEAWKAYQKKLVGDVTPEEIEYYTGKREPGENFETVSTREAFEAGWDARKRAEFDLRDHTPAVTS